MKCSHGLNVEDQYCPNCDAISEFNDLPPGTRQVRVEDIPASALAAHARANGFTESMPTRDQQSIDTLLRALDAKDAEIARLRHEYAEFARRMVDSLNRIRAMLKGTAGGE